MAAGCLPKLPVDRDRGRNPRLPSTWLAAGGWWSSWLTDRNQAKHALTETNRWYAKIFTNLLWKNKVLRIRCCGFSPFSLESERGLGL